MPPPDPRHEGSVTESDHRPRWEPAGAVHPSASDPVVRVASEVAGGPVGRRAVPGTAGPRGLLVAVAVAVVGLAAALRSHCRATGWASPDQFVHACYSDVPALVASSGLADGASPWQEGGGLAQPVGTAALLWVLAWLSPAGDSQLRWVFDLGAVLVAAAAAATTAAVVALARRRPWDGGLVALSPVVVVAGLVSLDLLAVALATLAALAWARRSPAGAGVLLGAAVAVRPLTAVLLLALVVPAARDGQREPAARLGGATVLTWVTLNVPVALLATDGWLAWWRGLAAQGAGYGSLWLLPSLAGLPVPAEAVRVASAVGVVAVLGATAAWAWRSPRRPGPAAVTVVALVGTLVVMPSLPVQASLLVLPAAALAVPAWRDHLLWGAAEVAAVTGTWLYLYGLSVPERGLPAWAYGTLLVLRVLALAWLAARAAGVVLPQRAAAGISGREPAHATLAAPGRLMPADPVVGGGRPD